MERPAQSPAPADQSIVVAAFTTIVATIIAAFAAERAAVVQAILTVVATIVEPLALEGTAADVTAAKLATVAKAIRAEIAPVVAALAPIVTPVAAAVLLEFTAVATPVAHERPPVVAVAAVAAYLLALRLCGGSGGRHGQREGR